MKRMTVKRDDGRWGLANEYRASAAMARLAAYEDTGLEPEEIGMARAEKDNEPLTLDELREMDGEPVWCRSEHRPGAEGWFLVDGKALQPNDFIAVGKERGIPCAGIESGYWLAYRRKPEDGTP